MSSVRVQNRVTWVDREWTIEDVNLPWFGDLVLDPQPF